MNCHVMLDTCLHCIYICRLRETELYLVDADGPVALELPNQWLWNIIDEFIYQFQAFSQFRSKLAKKVTCSFLSVTILC